MVPLKPRDIRRRGWRQFRDWDCAFCVRAVIEMLRAWFSVDQRAKSQGQALLWEWAGSFCQMWFCRRVRFQGGYLDRRSLVWIIRVKVRIGIMLMR